MNEHGIQNTIRNDLAGDCHLFRANVGKGWQGAGKPFRATSRMTVALNPGDVVLRNARPFDTGLPPGFHDTFGWVEVKITPAMVGLTLARFLSIEVKDDDGRISKGQKLFRAAVNNSGGASGIARNVADARAIVADAKAGRTIQ